jgi:hypothetical protein
MPTLKVKEGELEVPISMIARAADRMFKLGNKARSDDYAAKAKKRLEAGPNRKSDAAIVLAADGWAP